MNQKGEVILQIIFTQDLVPGSTHRQRTQPESWQEPRKKKKTKEASSNVIDERCQILRYLREPSDNTLQQTKLTKDASNVEDLQQEFFQFKNHYQRAVRH